MRADDTLVARMRAALRTDQRRAEHARQIVESMVRGGGYAKEDIAEMVGRVTGIEPERRELRQMIKEAHRANTAPRAKKALVT